VRVRTRQATSSRSSGRMIGEGGSSGKAGADTGTGMGSGCEREPRRRRLPLFRGGRVGRQSEASNALEATRAASSANWKANSAAQVALEARTDERSGCGAGMEQLRSTTSWDEWNGFTRRGAGGGAMERWTRAILTQGDTACNSKASLVACCSLRARAGQAMTIRDAGWRGDVQSIWRMTGSAGDGM
jgi:hypothetical protein